MPSVYKLPVVLSHLEEIPGVFDGNPRTELDGAGEQLAEQIHELHRVPEREGFELPPMATEGQSGDGLPDREEYEDDEVPIFHFPAGIDLETSIAKLAGASGEHYRRLILKRGVDALGYYLTFHQRSYQWGIYLPMSGVAWICVNVFNQIEIDALSKVKLSISLILAHERFHFAADCAAAQMELIKEKALFWPARRTLDADLRLLEEKAANAFMLRRMRSSPLARKARGSYEAATRFSLSQPPGYRDAHTIVANRFKFDNGVLDHAQKFLAVATGSDLWYGIEWQRLYPLDSSADHRSCPIHLISDERRFDLSEIGFKFIQSVVIAEETPRFGKQLRALGAVVAETWQRTKRKMHASVQLSGLDFKQWTSGGPNCFSVRVTASYRAHLSFQPKQQSWIATDIGNHKQMGHG